MPPASARSPTRRKKKARKKKESASGDSIWDSARVVSGKGSKSARGRLVRVPVMTDPWIGRGVSPPTDSDEMVARLRQRYESMLLQDSASGAAATKRRNAVEALKAAAEYTKTPDERRWGRAVSPPGTYVAPTNAINRGTVRPGNVWHRAIRNTVQQNATVHFVLVPHDILGTKPSKPSKATGPAFTSIPSQVVADKPAEGVVVVDAVGPDFAGPRYATGSAADTYTFLGIRNDDAFPDEIVEAALEEGDAKRHRYELPSGGSVECIHVRLSMDKCRPVRRGRSV